MSNINKEPLISVVTTTFNAIKAGRLEFFKQCLESVHNQTYKNIEHIVQDGGSTDGTLEFLKEYEKKGYIKLYSEKDKGIDDGYNNGCKKANGDYVAILNDDEYYYNDDVIKDVVFYLIKDNYDYCYGDIVILDNKTKRIVDRSYGINFLNDFWLTMSANHSTFFVKKEVYQKLNYYSLEYGTAGDYDFVIRLVLNDFKGVYVPKYIINYYNGGTSTSMSDDVAIGGVGVLLSGLYSNCYHNITPEIAFSMHRRLIGLSGIFLQRLKLYIRRLELKNFDYGCFNQYVDELININNHYNGGCNNYAIKLFGFIPLLKVRQKGKSIYYKLFNQILVFTKRIKLR
jgi:glycosyltransferase involved in cell wall biosynthesis